MAGAFLLVIYHIDKICDYDTSNSAARKCLYCCWLRKSRSWLCKRFAKKMGYWFKAPIYLRACTAHKSLNDEHHWLVDYNGNLSLSVQCLNFFPNVSRSYSKVCLFPHLGVSHVTLLIHSSPSFSFILLDQPPWLYSSTKLYPIHLSLAPLITSCPLITS